MNWRYVQGACRTGLHDGDEVLWAYDTAQRPLILRLNGPTHVAVGVPFAVSVRDGWIRANGSDGGPVAGALVDGSSTASDGQARLQFAASGGLSAARDARRSDRLKRAQRLRRRRGMPGIRRFARTSHARRAPRAPARAPLLRPASSNQHSTTQKRSKSCKEDTSQHSSLPGRSRPSRQAPRALAARRPP